MLEHKFVKHFRLLSSAIYLLSKQNISIEDIGIAGNQLNEFVDNFEILYGKSNVTINTHLLRHLAASVMNLGPLWAQSAYAFEANNGIVAKGNTCTKDIVHQLTWKYVMKNTIPKEIRNMTELSLNGKKKIKISSIEHEVFAEEGFEVSDFLNIYQSIIFRGIKYTSEHSKIVSTVDFFVRLKNDCICSIRFYVLFGTKLYALVYLYDCIETSLHFKKIKKNESQQIIQISDIAEKMIFLQFGPNEYVTTIPNKYEKT